MSSMKLDEVQRKVIHLIGILGFYNASDGISQVFVHVPTDASKDKYITAIRYDGRVDKVDMVICSNDLPLISFPAVITQGEWVTVYTILSVNFNKKYANQSVEFNLPQIKDIEI